MREAPKALRCVICKTLLHGELAQKAHLDPASPDRCKEIDEFCEITQPPGWHGYTEAVGHERVEFDQILDDLKKRDFNDPSQDAELTWI